MSLIALWALLGSFFVSSLIFRKFINAKSVHFCSVWLNQVDFRKFFDGFIGFRGRSFRIWQKEKNLSSRSKSTKIPEFKKSELGDSSTDFENFYTKQFLLIWRTTYQKIKPVAQRFRVPLVFRGYPSDWGWNVRRSRLQSAAPSSRSRPPENAPRSEESIQSPFLFSKFDIF